MKIILIIILLSFSLIAWSQDTTKTTQNSNKQLFLGLSFSPDLAYRTESSNYYFTEEIAKIGYTTGISARLNITKKFDLESGLFFSNKGYKNNFYGLTFGDMIDPRRGFIYNTQNAPSEVEYIYSYYYLDIPIKAVFTFGQRKIHFFTSAGITPNILIKATETSSITYQSGNNETNTQDAPFNYNHFNLSPTISLGISRNTEKSILKIEPYYSYGLLKIINAPSTAYLWNYGINIAYYININ